jgi:two-component system, sensor histidine kinase YesM
VSIRNRLFIMLLVMIILPYFLSVIFIYENSKSAIEERDLAKSRDELRESGENLEQYIEGMTQLPYSLFNMPEVQTVLENGLLAESTDHIQAFENRVETYAATRPDIRQLRFYFEQDQQSLTIYKANVSAPKPAPDYMENPIFRSLYSAEDAYTLGVPHVLKNEDNVAIVPASEDTVVLPINHKITDVLSGEFLGFLTTDVELSSFAPLLDAITKEAGTQVLLVNGSGRVMYSEEAKQVGKRLQKEQLKSSEDNIVLNEELGDPLTDWRLIKVTSKEVLFRDAKDAAWTSVLLGVGVVALGVVLVIVISRVFTKPIIELSDKVRSIEGGQMHVELRTDRQDEIGYLSAHIQDMLNRVDAHIEREYKLELEVKESQLRMLKSQVNPHFLFNAIQSIGAVALRSGDRDVYKLLVSLSKMMRYALQADQLVPVREELAYVDSYVMLQRERFGSGMDVAIQVEEKMQEFRIPSMLLQPLVENYFKHSFEHVQQASRFVLKGSESNGEMVFRARSYGVQVNLERLQLLRKQEAGGTGLRNIAERLRLHYDGEAAFHLDNLNGEGFEVTIRIPLRN